MSRRTPMAVSEKAAFDRELRRQFRDANTGAATAPAACPECGTPRRTAETLRVHRWIAHDVREVS